MNKQNNAIVVTSIISGVILIIALIALFAFQSANPYSKNSLTVQGISSVKATPDLISVYFNIETKGKTSSEAKNANTEIYNKLVSSLADEGFDESEIKTQGFHVYPNIYWENSKQKEDGFIATHSIKLEMPSDEFNKLTSVIDAGVDSGAGISYINFELTQDSQNEYKAQALGLASQDARIKAEAVASGFNKKAGKLVSVSVNEFGYYPWNVYTARAESGSGATSEDFAMAKEAVMNLTPSEQEISATVSATFKLK